MSAAAKGKGLGRGLGALMGEQTVSALDSHAIHELDINEVSPNQSQPRKDFNQERLQELADSIKENGVIQPIIVTQQHGTYLIVAGERRWRAARLAGLKKIPAIVRELSNAQILQQALIENLQRQDLNPIETAEALKKLAEDYNMTQEKLSTTVGMSRPALANTLRLLNLSPKIRQMVVEELLTQGHARALLALPDSAQQEKYANLIVERQLSVRETEKLIRRLLDPEQQQQAIPVEAALPDAYKLSVTSVETKLSQALGTKVSLKASPHRKKGKIIIEYYSNEDLDRLTELISQKQFRPTKPDDVDI